MATSPVSESENPDILNFASSLIDSIREPLLVINSQAIILAANDRFYTQFDYSLNAIEEQNLFTINDQLWNSDSLKSLFSQLQEGVNSIKGYPVVMKAGNKKDVSAIANGRRIEIPGKKFPLFLLSFEVIKINETKEIDYKKLLNEILSEAPAVICTLRGPEHTFELANEKYLKLVDNRDCIGKTVKESLPEVESQGFIQILDTVYQTGEPFIGKEIPLELNNENGLKHTLLDFLYQPIKNAQGKVEGIFVHAIDVTENVRNRKILEESERDLKNLIDTVPAMVWLSNKMGEASYLNKSWYEYTGQSKDEGLGTGWLQAVHPEERNSIQNEIFEVISKNGDIHQTFRLKNQRGEYRWVTNRGKPKYGANGDLQGYVGNILDVHDERMKEQVILEREHRTRSIVEEATVATAIYVGREIKIELANDAMLNLWGKSRSVVGQSLQQALPELDDQPFYDILQNVFTTGETYWGKEVPVDLERNGKLERGVFNFTYKPLRNGKGEIYGILNMALEVTDMVASRNLLKQREKHYRLMADLMPEKVFNTNPAGEAIYFNKNWLDYSGMSSIELQNQNWKEFIYPEDRDRFNSKWQNSLKTGSSFETEVRLKDRNGDYLWHLSRAEAVKNEQGEITMWIGTNTEIQKLKEEEKRKEDFLKMVSHELKTPVTSIKGYVQLLLNNLKEDGLQHISGLPLKPSLKRIDSQIIRLTRLISEMLDLSRLEENKLELQKEIFSINDLIEQTVQDIKLTNTQHEMKIFHSARCNVVADKDRIGQVLINFITNAIKYSPDSQYIEIHIEMGEEDNVVVRVVDKGIGIGEKDVKNIFKRFYRIGVESEETYAGFGIGLYIANEIIQRHNGSIKVISEKGKGSDFSFSLLKA